MASDVMGFVEPVGNSENGRQLRLSCPDNAQIVTCNTNRVASCFSRSLLVTG